MLSQDASIILLSHDGPCGLWVLVWWEWRWDIIFILLFQIIIILYFEDDWINNHHTETKQHPAGWRTQLGHPSEVSAFTRAMALVVTGIICAAIAYVSYTAWALTGFGSAIIFQILVFHKSFYGSGDIVDGLLYLSIAGVAVMPYQAMLLRNTLIGNLSVLCWLIYLSLSWYKCSPGCKFTLVKAELRVLFLFQWFKMVYTKDSTS